jgi:hypothetical protein
MTIQLEFVDDGINVAIIETETIPRIGETLTIPHQGKDLVGVVVDVRYRHEKPDVVGPAVYKLVPILLCVPVEKWPMRHEIVKKTGYSLPQRG